MPERSHDWMRQAKRDLESAKTQMKRGSLNGPVLLLNKGKNFI